MACPLDGHRFGGPILVGSAVPAPPTAPLTGTRWQLDSIQSMDDSQGTVRPTDPSRYTLEFRANGQVSVRLDCHRGLVAWKAAPAEQSDHHRSSGQLMLGPLASTQAKCASESLAPRLVSSWPFVRSYVVEAGRLHLSLMADGGSLTWEPVR